MDNQWYLACAAAPDGSVSGRPEASRNLADFPQHHQHVLLTTTPSSTGTGWPGCPYALPSPLPSSRRPCTRFVPMTRSSDGHPRPTDPHGCTAAHPWLDSETRSTMHVWPGVSEDGGGNDYLAFPWLLFVDRSLLVGYGKQACMPTG